MSTNPQADKKKKERACDGCRRRKTKCDGPLMEQNICTNCIQSNKECTYMWARLFISVFSLHLQLHFSEVSKPRGPPKAYVLVLYLSFILLQLSSYVTGLEERLESLEALLQQVRLIFFNFFVAHLNAFVRYVRIRISLKSWDLQLSVDPGRLTSSRLLHLRPSLLSLNLRTFQLQILLYLIVNARPISRFRVPKDHEQSPKQSRLRVRAAVISLMTRPQILHHHLQIQKKCL